jgi:hypothetical protein
MKTKEEKNSLEEDIKGYHDLVIPIPLVAVSFITPFHNAMQYED